MIWKTVKRMPLSVRGRLVAELGTGSELKKVSEYIVVGEQSDLLVRRCSSCGDIYLISTLSMSCLGCGETGQSI